MTDASELPKEENQDNGQSQTAVVLSLSIKPFRVKASLEFEGEEFFSVSN